ncbi:hypothetical protein [Bacillus haynesii]|uniref:hypothetical protein n=1 Tax=Bacillus haynesii TaxID=1925021 RepID=UPI00227DC5D9|nr:hypothetical protein [Bacillus haynesii]MCY7861080.1 hypothetical protein [Bacillus haynesii]
MSTVLENCKRVAVVKFDSGYKSYDFKNDIKEIELGDKAVVKTSLGFTVGNVVDFKLESRLASEWVIQRVDTESYENRLQKEKRKKELKALMERRSKELEELEAYKKLGENDNTMSDLVKEYEELTKGVK